MYSEKLDSDPVTLSPPPAASPDTPLVDLSRVVFPAEPRDCDSPTVTERRPDKTKSTLRYTL